MFPHISFKTRCIVRNLLTTPSLLVVDWDGLGRTGKDDGQVQASYQCSCMEPPLSFTGAGGKLEATNITTTIIVPSEAPLLLWAQ